MHYLVLGSSGQVGAALCEYYKARNHDVELFDIAENPSQDLKMYQNKLLKEKMSRCDFVFFLAFDVGGSRYLKKHQRTFGFVHNNMRLMTNTFECLKKTGKPFIFASSQMSAMNHSSYGVLKKIGEYYTSSLNGLTVKFWNIYGAEKDLEKSHVITDFILKAKNTRIIDMATDGKEARQFLYVEDCCECLDVLSTRYDSLEKNKPYHISGFKWNTVLEVAEEVASCFKGTIIKPSLNTDSVQRSEKLEPDKYILNYWIPKTSLGDGIRKVVSLYND
jgi:nucleoside-diphosphate-sugar epimerase